MLEKILMLKHRGHGQWKLPLEAITGAIEIRDDLHRGMCMSLDGK